MHLPDPEFPPLLAGHAVKAPQRAFDRAVAGALEGRLGAGDLLWGRDVDRLDLAVVLEPSVSASKSMEMLGVVLVAVGDSLGALVPPEISVTFAWPNVVNVNGAEAGLIRVAISHNRPVDDVPDWMVIGIAIELRRKNRLGDPGHAPDVTDLYEEGCGEITRTDLVESLSRHFLAWTHTWETEGFRPVHEMLVPRVDHVGEEIDFEFNGRRYLGRFVGLDEHGNMLLHTESGPILLRALDLVESAEEVLG